MEDLLGGLLNGDSLLFLLHTLHELLSICILTGHDIADAEVGEDDSRDREKVVHLAADKWLVIANGVTILIILHKEDVGDIELPCLVFAAELGRLAEDFLDHGVVAIVPVDLGLHHEDGDVLVESQVILLKGIVDRLAISGNSCVLDRLGLLAERVDVLVG